MPELDDHELLAEFARNESEAAFAALAARYVNLVYSTARRFAGDPHHAEEITQAVFVILVRKAGKLSPRTVLSGWLYQTARLTAANFVKGEIRRQHREQEAYMQSILTEQDAAAWQQLAPHLDEAMGRLGETDRNAIVLRFFENKTAREVGAALKLTEAAAHKRVNRALDKLRKIFSKRGVMLTATVIAGAVAANSVQAAPAALAKSITAVAITKGAAASVSTLTLIKGALKIMAWTKAKVAIGAVAGLVLATSVSVVVIQKDSLIQGKTESEWIKSIVYNGDDKQRKLWHSLGPRGIRMLVRAMKPPPDGLAEEQAIANRKTRMCAADLLCQLADNREDRSAVSDVIKLLQTEKDDSVRGLELGYFEMPIQTMSEKDKAALLPELIRSLGRDHSGERNNALVALQYYANQKETVVPLTVKAMQDPISGVRVMAVKALNHLDPQNPASSNFVSVLAECVTRPPGDMPGAPNDAVLMLGELLRDPDIAVPALVQALQSDDNYVRSNAATELGKFGGQAKAAIPALTKTLEDSDARVRRQAGDALKRINSGAASN